MKTLKIIPLLVFAFACSEPPEAKLRRSNRVVADSLYKEQLKMLTEEQDSLCIERENNFLKATVDSILQLRRAKIKEQINRSKN